MGGCCLRRSRRSIAQAVGLAYLLQYIQTHTQAAEKHTTKLTTELWSLELLGSAVSRIDTTAPNPFPGMLVFADAEVLYTPGHTLSKDGCYNGDARAPEPW